MCYSNDNIKKITIVNIVFLMKGITYYAHPFIGLLYFVLDTNVSSIRNHSYTLIIGVLFTV